MIPGGLMGVSMGHDCLPSKPYRYVRAHGTNKQRETSADHGRVRTRSVSARSRDLIHNTSRTPLHHSGYRNEDEAIRRKFESRRDLALANKFKLKKKLFNMKLKNGQNLQDHLKVFVELFEEMAIIGDAIVEEERVIILLSSLPDRFSTLVTALETNEKIPAWEVVTERLLNEERRQRGGHGTSDSSEKLPEIDIVYCPSNDMLADIFTKGVSAKKFSRLRRKLDVVFFRKHIQCEKEC
ncbi:hypothetical protein FHG87_021426 [Trinorchestia longiramus]|nr:hypothetical protein FHG87_021426 [Trinorchestia longiramus]